MPPKRKTGVSEAIKEKGDVKSPPKKIHKVETNPPEMKKKKIPVELIIKNNYPDHYRKLEKSNYLKKTELFQQITDEENKYRELYAQERDSALLKDEHLLMIDVQKNLDIFPAVALTEEEKNMPYIFPVGDKKKAAGESTVVSGNEFQRNWDVFTESQLKYLNWNNVFAAGGSVLACMMPCPEEHGQNNRTKRNYYHKVAYKSSDIDLFIYGLNEEEANKKIQEIYDAVREAIPVEAIAFRSQHAVTIVSAV